VLGLAGTAFANPYSDVPAGHWAYKAVNDLSKAGIVEGYNGKYNGNATITRYEAAAITARALAKADKADAATKATIDKLAVEFSKELNDLGVRVAKLEKNQSKIKWTGDTRLRWVDEDKADDSSDFGQRVRLYFTADVNEDVTFVGKYLYSDTTKFGNNDDKARLYEAHVTHKGLLGGGSAITLGRMSQKVGVLGYFLDSTGNFDGAQVVIPSGKFTFTGVFADMGKYFSAGTSYKLDGTDILPVNNQLTDKNVSIGKIDYKASDDFALSGWYLGTGSVDYDVYGIGFNYGFAKNWRLISEYVNIDDSIEETDNYQVRLQYKGVNAAVPGSFGAFVEYVKYEGAALDTGSNAGITNNEKGISIGYQAAVLKNVTFEAFFSPDIKAVNGDKNGAGEKYTRAQLNYLF
jgi:hypothetical protein